MASTLFWLFFWVCFGFLTLFKVKGLLWILFLWLLHHMITTNNQMSQHCWVAFWLSFGHIFMDFHIYMDKAAFGFLMLVSTVVCWFSTFNYTIPTPVFWVLVWLLASTVHGPSWGSLFWYILVILNLHVNQDGIHLPGLRISYYIVAALLAATVLLGNYRYYGLWYMGVVVLIWVITIGILHNQMWPYNKEFSWRWIGAWFLLLQAFQFSFPPSMPPLWYPMQLGIVVGLGFAFRPDISLGRFALWAITIWVIRMVLFCIYIFYILGFAVLGDMFPFTLFSHKWKSGRTKWLPLASRNPDSLNHATLCEQCDRFTSNSNLIMGSSYLTRLVEWHEFWAWDEYSSKFKRHIDELALDTDSEFPESSCHLCCLLWYSVSPTRRDTLAADFVALESAGQLGGAPSKEKDLSNTLRIKIWEERPLSLYTYLQLYRGETALGARLLVHRDDLCASPSPAILQRETGSVEHLEQAKKWLKLCMDNHKLCQAVGNARLELPARMLYVCGSKDWRPGNPPETLKLVQISQAEAGIDYLALSHCWGPPAEMKFKLLASNIDACYETIDFTGLSKNMQDAITTTISLGFSYIWIDSLCIIQKDDKGNEVGNIATICKKDWEIESKKMGSVYSGAACTIASTGSSTSTGGCFHSRSTKSLQPCKIGVSSLSALSPKWIYARVDDVFEFERSVDLAPLNTRGWVMQERLLSRRILHFGANMLLWECCGRAASELRPHGYTYKDLSKDFDDNYAPNIGSYITTRGDQRKAHLAGKGISWAASERIRRRPPPVMLDPDLPSSSQTTWQLKRAFWKNVLKPTDEPWDQDEGDESDDRPRAGFRAAFERLLSGELSHDTHGSQSSMTKVGRYSFSQVWYEVVGSYSRGRLTAPTDKLIALKGVEDEVARATKFTYFYGLWKETIVTDLLWFAIEGPGKRLLTIEGNPVAPSWSWASIEKPVSLDLLPENALMDISEMETFVTIDGIGPNIKDPRDMTITLSGPLLPVVAAEIDGTLSTIDIGETGNPSARLFLDVETPAISEMTGLACLSFVALNREKGQWSLPSSSEDVQGLLLRLVHPGEEDGGLDVYERVGYFTTSYIPRSRASRRGRKALKGAVRTKLCLTGWSQVVAPPVVAQSV